MHRLKTPETGMGDRLARVFHCAVAEHLGGYQSAVERCQNCTQTNTRGVFVQSRPPPLRPFLDSIPKLQAFEQFLEESIGVELTEAPWLEPPRRTEKMYRALRTSGTLSPLEDTGSPLGENENSTPMEERLEILNSREVQNFILIFIT